jgi:dethiobiotin synthetase
MRPPEVHRVKVLGVILNDTEGMGDMASQTNPAMLEKYLDVPLLGVFPHTPDLFEKGVDRERLADLLARNIDCSVLEDRKDLTSSRS